MGLGAAIDCLDTGYAAFQAYLFQKEPTAQDSFDRAGKGLAITLLDMASLLWGSTRLVLHASRRYHLIQPRVADAVAIGVGVACSAFVAMLLVVKAINHFTKSKSTALDEIVATGDPITFHDVTMSFERSPFDKARQNFFAARLLIQATSTFLSSTPYLNFMNVALLVYSLFKVTQLNWLTVTKILPLTTLGGERRTVQYSILLTGHVEAKNDLLPSSTIRFCPHHVKILQEVVSLILKKLIRFADIPISSHTYYERGVGKVTEYYATVSSNCLPQCNECNAQPPVRQQIELWYGSHPVHLQM